MDFGVQFSSIWVGGACDKAFISGANVESVEIREDGFRDSQEQGEEPDERRLQDDARRGDWMFSVQGFDNGPVPR